MKDKSLYDVMYVVYKEINNVKRLPNALKYRLNNINARYLNYRDFIYYFDLKNEYEVFKFILDDQNMEEILRYSLRMNILYEKIILKPDDYLSVASKEHLIIDNMLIHEEMEYHK